jgi:hypothetical protein
MGFFKIRLLLEVSRQALEDSGFDYKGLFMYYNQKASAC